MSQYVIKSQVFTAPAVPPALYLAATPIGNLGDITLRVLEHLAGSDLIACEDTRVTGKLLRHYGIKRKLLAYHEHNADTAGPMLLEEVRSGRSVVLVSDAGTPIVSDPGFRLVVQAREMDIPIIPLPGASAPLAALVASGLSAETWLFAGFLPAKKGARLTRLSELATVNATLIVFESPKRVHQTLDEMRDAFGPKRRVCLARELTKLHEEIKTAPLEALIAEFNAREVRGEVVLVVAPPAQKSPGDTDTLLKELLQTMPLSQAAAEAAALTGVSKRDLYQRALALKESANE
ncbi:MAG: 16S rRNA (cytidine(1402)-2'-O)-methyltransferase [Pseudomonadota bacterium]